MKEQLEKACNELLNNLESTREAASMLNTLVENNEVGEAFPELMGKLSTALVNTNNIAEDILFEIESMGVEEESEDDIEGTE